MALKFTLSNVLGTHTLLECAKMYGKLQKIVVCSSDEVYGEQSHIKNEPSNENTNLEPTNPYAATKASSEHIVNSYRISFKLPTIITRANNIFGPRQFPEKLIPKFITRLSQNKPCQLHGDGTNKRSYLHVQDFCEAYDIILHKGEIGKVYNIGSELEYKNIDIWKSIINIFRGEYPQYLNCEDNKEYLEYVRDRDFNDRRYWIDSTEMIKLGWEQKKIDLDESLKDVVKWYLDNPNHWENLGTALNAHQK